MRKIVTALAMLGVAACAAPNPNEGAGVGFSDYTEFEAERLRREAALTGAPLPPALQVSDETPAVSADAGRAVSVNNPGISDEQSFDAVSGRETIESDAERIARQREAYEVIEPEALPDRPSDTGPNIVEFALSTTNKRGESIYRRSGTTTQSRFERACARYSSADLAQIAFLDSGGPENDRRGLDPDGDGFACFWDPAPFRAARN